MGILANTKQYLANKTVSAANKMGDGIAKLATLSPKQIELVDSKREAYLAGKPDMIGDEARAIIEKNMGAIGIEVYQAYLDQLSNIYSPVDALSDNFDAENRIRFFEITKWVRDTEEKSIDKLVNVYQVLSEETCNIALIYNRKENDCHIYIGVVNTDERFSDPSIVDKYYHRMVSAIKGNFPGTDYIGMNSDDPDYGVGMPPCLDALDAEKNNQAKSIAIVSNVPSEKSEGFISQSMEKLLDGIVPEEKAQEYTIVLLAKPIKRQLDSKNRLYELYTALAPYTTWQTGYTYTESDGVSSSANFGVNLGVGAGANATVNSSQGTSIANAVQKGSSDTLGGHVGGKHLGGDYHHTWNRSTTDTMGSNESTGTSSGAYASANFGVSFARSSSVTAQIGKNESITQTYTNFGVKHTLDIIESQLQRIEESSALGMWEFASYFVSESPVIANNAAHMYLALTQGEDSYLTKAAVNFWDGELNSDASKVLLSSIKNLQHPVFGLKASLEDEWLMYPTLVTPTAPLSGKELAQALNFPRKSVSGLPVLEVVSFGREPHSLINQEFDLEIGCGYHMRKKIPEKRVKLSKDELTKHTFITGSTGSGKSNTIYKLLEKLGCEGVKFLVIEPAKGEYKDKIGKIDGVVTYGTNPNITGIEMLRLNPFRFPENTHILEHLDRLVEIFNVCWPMYAAMPAILKDSVERAYIKSGWDLEKSVNRYSPDLFPTFNDVVREIRQVLEESEYSDDNKGDYTGSLVTRLRSLTNGINGLIFSTDDLRDENIFDRNVIVDLSRVGSAETKSLIMGILVLKLQEHRMEQRCMGANTDDNLKHVTVLEEAHNLLKRTSTEQSSEGSNMLGKSVEMLANSIAEMRTYGEGFIIADQSPGLLDMSVIRNTNTKIILRLPDFGDRELVGKASGLSDNQITEIAKLEKGVAAISQSDWLEPVLCKVDLYTGKYIDRDGKEKEVKFHTDLANSVYEQDSVHTSEVEKSLLDCIMTKEIYRKGDRVDIQELKVAILKSKLDTIVKCDFLDYIVSDKERAIDSLRTLVYDFLEAEQAINSSKKCKDINEWVHSVADKLSPDISAYSNRQINLVMALLIYEQTIRDSSYNDLFCRFTEIYKSKGGVY